jgi:hypothetical protein
MNIFLYVVLVAALAFWLFGAYRDIKSSDGFEVNPIWKNRIWQKWMIRPNGTLRKPVNAILSVLSGLLVFGLTLLFLRIYSTDQTLLWLSGILVLLLGGIVRVRIAYQNDEKSSHVIWETYKTTPIAIIWREQSPPAPDVFRVKFYINYKEFVSDWFSRSKFALEWAKARIDEGK